ncbi:MAG: hypothetical protein GX601_15815 [Anaerolineales bacterium]|nr:hypothetical protein [Anaerolineales bacterium]
MGERTLTLETSQDVLGFCRKTGRLVSFRSKLAPDQEFVVGKDDDPVFVIQYLDNQRRYRQIASGQAQETTLTRDLDGEGRLVLRGVYRGLAGLDLDATVTVVAAKSERFSRWSIALRDGAGLEITDVQFPFITLSYDLPGTPGSGAVVWPFNHGKLYKDPKPEHLTPDSPHAWQFRPENGDASHYPGLVMAQFLAYYNDRAGIYVACEDTEGRVKLIKPVHRDPGLRLGFGHWGDWPTQGERKLEYDVVLGSFSGDWYAAADLYRQWSLQQRWAQKPLYKREDMPEWLLDSPPHIILRIQGELDAGTAEPKEEFLPYPKMMPMLDAIAERIDAPLVGVIMSWERPGPWIYPDCFPPAGGEESLHEFTDLMRARGWRVGTFCNGTRWVVGHFWSGYDGEAYFEEKNGASSVCQNPDGSLWQEHWDSTWRPSYPGCLGVKMTYDIAMDFVRKVRDMGLDWIQFLDQNVGACTFPCFARDHGHPPSPGRWMTERMQDLADGFKTVREETLEASEGERKLVFSAEATVSEYFLSSFHLTDVRVVPPGHRPGDGFIPLYHFLFHELIIIQGGFGAGPEPYHMPTRNAYNLVTGEIPGAVMTGNGHLLNWDTFNWAPWSPEVGDNDDSLEVLATTTALRRGPAKDFLVFGRMLSPSKIEGIRTIRWQDGGKDHRIPAVFDGAWQAPDGRFGLVLANWTTENQKVTVADPRMGGRVQQYVSTGEGMRSDLREVGEDGQLALTLPPLSCALIEQKA